MQAEVLAIGDELTSGQRLDTNSQWLSQQLGDLGIRVCYHTSVGDDQAALVEALRTTAKRSTVAIMSGGLGPTADDITRQVLSGIDRKWASTGPGGPAAHRATVRPARTRHARQQSDPGPFSRR